MSKLTELQAANKALTEQNASLLEKISTLEAELEKERTGDIKLPMAPSPRQYNLIVDWCAKIKAWYESAKPVPERMEAEPHEA